MRKYLLSITIQEVLDIQMMGVQNHLKEFQEDLMAQIEKVVSQQLQHQSLQSISHFKLMGKKVFIKSQPRA